MPPKLHFDAKTLIRNKRVSEESFNKLRVWCSSQKLPYLSDEQLSIFLLSCNNDFEATQKTIFAHFKAKSGSPELFLDRGFDSETVQQVMKMCQLGISPIRTPENCAVLFFRLSDTSYSQFVIENLLKVVLMVGELVVQDNPPDGIVVVIDMKGFGLMHITKLRVGPLKKFFHFLQEGFYCKIRQIHILNTVYFIEKVMFVLKPLMNKEIYHAISYHSSNVNMNEFFNKHVPKKCFVEDYGGDVGSLDYISSQTFNVFRGLKQFYVDEENQVYEYLDLQKKQ